MKSKKKPSKKDADWAKAKKLCRLNQNDIRMAIELGFKPKSLIKNIPNPSEKWKTPVKYWIRDLYYERFGKIVGENTRTANNHSKKPEQDIPIDQESVDDSLWLAEPIENVDEHRIDKQYFDDEIPF